MTHANFREAIAEGRYDVSVKSHLAGCEDCRRFEKAIGDVDSYAIDVKREVQRGPRTRSRGLVAVASVAAVALIAFGLATRTQQTEPEPPTVQFASTTRRVGDQLVRREPVAVTEGLAGREVTYRDRLSFGYSYDRAVFRTDGAVLETLRNGCRLEPEIPLFVPPQQGTRFDGATQGDAIGTDNFDRGEVIRYASSAVCPDGFRGPQGMTPTSEITGSLTVLGSRSARIAGTSYEVLEVSYSETWKSEGAVVGEAEGTRLFSPTLQTFLDGVTRVETVEVSGRMADIGDQLASDPIVLTDVPCRFSGCPASLELVGAATISEGGYCLGATLREGTRFFCADSTRDPATRAAEAGIGESVSVVFGAVPLASARVQVRADSLDMTITDLPPLDSVRAFAAIVQAGSEPTVRATDRNGVPGPLVRVTRAEG